MNICKVWDSEYPWDVRVEKISQALSARAHKVHIVARNRDHRAVLEELPEAIVHRLRPLPRALAWMNAWSMFPAFFNPRWLRLIQATAKETGSDLILCRDVPLAPTAIWVGARLGIPVVLDVAENYPAMIQDIWTSGSHKWTDWLVRNPQVVSQVERWVTHRVDHVLVVVEESRDRLISLGVHPDRITIVSNTPPLARVREYDASRRVDGTLRLVYLGLLERPRGVGLLLEAVASALARGLSVQLSIVGDGRDASEFENQARALGLDDRAVRFHGFLPHREALRIVQQADVGVVPHWAGESWNTTVPNKLFDYMAAGLPVIVSDTKPCARIVREVRSGESFRDRDVEDLVRAISRLHDAAGRAAYGRAGRQAVLTRYNWESDAKRLVTCLERVAQAASSRSSGHSVARSQQTSL